MHSQILRRKDVEAMIGLSRSTIYKLISQDMFPKPVQLGPAPWAGVCPISRIG